MIKTLKKIYETLVLTIKFFTTKRVMAKASALTYSTLLAIVPILAVVFAIARGFGYNKYIEVWFRDILGSQPQAADVIIGWVNSYLVHTKSGLFLGIGLVFMLYTVLMLVNNIEEQFAQSVSFVYELHGGILPVTVFHCGNNGLLNRDDNDSQQHA